MVSCHADSLIYNTNNSDFILFLFRKTNQHTNYDTSSGSSNELFTPSGDPCRSKASVSATESSYQSTHPY